MRLQRAVVVSVLASMIALALAACRSAPPPPPPGPPPPTPQEVAARKQAQEETQRKVEEEAKRPPEQFFAGAPHLYEGPRIEPPPPAPPGIPYDEAFPPKRQWPPPERVAVLTLPRRAESAHKVAVQLGEAERQRLEDRLGTKLQIVVISRDQGIREGQSEVHYRTGHLRTALALAASIPGPQRIEPMTLGEEAREGYDVLIYVGGELH